MESRRLPTDPFERRIEQLRRSYAAGCGGRLATEVACAIRNAAVYTARSERTALDPQSTTEEVYRAENLAKGARREMRKLLNAEREVLHDHYDADIQRMVEA